MKASEYKSYEDLPLFLNAETVSKVLGIAPSSAYELLHEQNFPSLRIRFHDLRHTFATLALQNGVDVKTLSSMLGHYSAGFTLDTYTHATMKMQIEAADKLGGFMAQTV